MQNLMKTNSLRRAVAVSTAALALVTMLVTSGCLAVAAGAGAGAAAVAYVRGELQTTVSEDYDATVKATHRAIDQLGFVKVSEKKDALIAILTVRNAADKKIEIRLDRSARNLTQVRIRVGVFGDEALSMAILDKIKANL